MERPSVEIVVCRCCRRSEPFGVRFEKYGRSTWRADWAFAVRERTIEREGYRQQQIEGSFELHPAFPGCPHCTNRGLVSCGCGSVACWDGQTRTVECPGCRARVEVGGVLRSLRVGGDP